MQVLFYPILLIAGALLAVVYFQARLKKINSDLSRKIDRLVPAAETSGALGKSFGFFNDLISLGNRIDRFTPATGKIPEVKSIPQENKHELENLKKRFDNLQVVNELGQQVTSSLSLQETFQHLYKTIHSMMDAAIVELGVYQWREGRFQILSNSAISGSEGNEDYKNPMAEWSFKNSREVFLTDAEKEYARYVFQPLTFRDGRVAQSVMCFPIVAKNKEYGTLCVSSFHKDAFNAYHVEMIRSLLPYTAVAIENAVIHQDLISMQEKIIHNEKMASIGQLTSGIAHEILNPLNFVNNFSEVSQELLMEILETKSESEQAELRNQLAENLSKINYHGNRAYGIVKSMMELSRPGKGEPTDVDIAKSIDHYLVIAYQGFIAKHPGFECAIEKKIPSSLLRKDMIAEDFGRVLLNVFNNAFYAMNEKRKKSQPGTTYEPVMSVSLEQVNSRIRLTVHDNGTGIPEEIKDKIFLPFFTTKPTGEGTGLGLSLSHDIIVKGNQGELHAISDPGKWTEFKIELPVK